MYRLRLSLTSAAVLTVLLAKALLIDVSVQGYSICGQPMGSLHVSILDGVPPYDIAWSNGATVQTITALSVGTYTVTVTDATSEQATASGTVTNLTSYPFSTFSALLVCPGEVPMVAFWGGTENGMPPDFTTGVQHGPGPYTFSAPGYDLTWTELIDCYGTYSYYNIDILGAQPGLGVTVSYTDGSGCPGSFDFTVPGPVSLPQPQVLSLSGSCTNGNIGSALVSVGLGPAHVRLKNSNGQYLGFGGYCANYPVASDGTVQFTGLAPGTYWAMVDLDEFGQYEYYETCRDSTEIVISDLGTTCGVVSGRVYVDNIVNCVLNGGENLVPSTLVEITPGPHYATTNSNGQYSLQLPFGTYTFTALHPVLEQSCPVSGTLSGATLNNVNIGFATGAPLDVQLTMGNSPARPGFQMTYAMDIDNLTPAVTGTVTLTMTFDPVLGFVSATPAPTSIAGNVLTWTAPTFTMTSAFQHRDVNVVLQIPPDVLLLGTTLETTATLVTQNVDNDLTNNTVNSEQLVTGSYDPNDKLATTSLGNDNVWSINEDEWIDYTIRFQNTGTDTAFNVIITDTLPANLDVSSIIWGASSHAHTRQVVGQGVLKYIFPNIMLPDSNVNETLSHGFVGFRIRPHLPLLPGEQIENIANIFFDYNPPVITEPSVLVATTGTGVVEQRISFLRLAPNPAQDAVEVLGFVGDVQQARIFSAEGRLVRTFGPAQGRNRFPLQGLGTGTYILELIPSAGTPIRLPLIISHH